MGVIATVPVLPGAAVNQQALCVLPPKQGGYSPMRHKMTAAAAKAHPRKRRSWTLATIFGSVHGYTCRHNIPTFDWAGGLGCGFASSWGWRSPGCRPAQCVLAIR